MTKGVKIYKIVKEFDTDDLPLLHALFPQGKKPPVEVPEAGR